MCCEEFSTIDVSLIPPSMTPDVVQVVLDIPGGSVSLALARFCSSTPVPARPLRLVQTSWLGAIAPPEGI